MGWDGTSVVIEEVEEEGRDWGQGEKVLNLGMRKNLAKNAKQ